MKLRAFAPRTETGKKFIKALEKLSYRHSVWNIWTDFIKLTAISLSNAREPREDIRLARENQYQNLFDMYTTEEQALFIDMFACLMLRTFLVLCTWVLILATAGKDNSLHRGTLQK